MSRKGISNAQQLKNSIDKHLLPKDPETVGEDWQGDCLYGYELGYIIDGEFISEEDIPEYIDATYSIRRSEEYFN